jgi:hypothetical protein
VILPALVTGAVEGRNIPGSAEGPGRDVTPGALVTLAEVGRGPVGVAGRGASLGGWRGKEAFGLEDDAAAPLRNSGTEKQVQVSLFLQLL